MHRFIYLHAARLPRCVRRPASVVRVRCPESRTERVRSMFVSDELRQCVCLMFTTTCVHSVKGCAGSRYIVQQPPQCMLWPFGLPVTRTVDVSIVETNERSPPNVSCSQHQYKYCYIYLKNKSITAGQSYSLRYLTNWLAHHPSCKLFSCSWAIALWISLLYLPVNIVINR